MFTKPVSKWLINQINGCLLRLLLGTYCYWDNCMTQLSQTKSSTVALKHQLAAKFGSWHQSIFFFTGLITWFTLSSHHPLLWPASNAFLPLNQETNTDPSAEPLHPPRSSDGFSWLIWWQTFFSCLFSIMIVLYSSHFLLSICINCKLPALQSTFLGK